jgi:hypothetical protein
MKKKLTPLEKKELAYKKDHRTRTGECDRAMSRLWAKRKARVNRKYRRKTDQALRKAISPDRIDAVLAGDDGTTRELIRKGLTREKNSQKWGVHTLRDLVEEKLESRVTPRETKRQRKERLSQIYIEGIIAFELDPDSAQATILRDAIRGGHARLWDFLRDHPEWKERLSAKIKQLQTAEQRQSEKARSKAELKRKWRSPKLRVPPGS